jgi:hypothetical protein
MDKTDCHDHYRRDALQSAILLESRLLPPIQQRHRDDCAGLMCECPVPRGAEYDAFERAHTDATLSRALRIATVLARYLEAGITPDMDAVAVLSAMRDGEPAG